VASYLFFPRADLAQDAIWDYTLGTWGEVQAEKYIVGLHKHLQNLAEKQAIWHALPSALIVPSDLDMSIYFSKYEHHRIFFRELSKNRIGIMSILHEQSDLPVRLAEDLRKL